MKFCVRVILTAGVFLGILAYCMGLGPTAAFTKVAATSVGQGTGLFIGSLATFATNITVGRAAVGGGASSTPGN